MSKIICDICGTSYPETAERCPICGSARDLSLSLEDEIEEEDIAPKPRRSKGGRFAASNVRRKGGRRTKPEEPEDGYDEDEAEDYGQDYDEDDDYGVNYDEDDYDEDEEYDDDEDSGSNTPLVILLVVVIVALLAVTGYIVGKYLLPNILQEETTAPSTVATTAAPSEETTEPTIPCESLVLTSGGEVSLEEEGLEWLLNVMALPEDTTDTITYSSSDESVVTVDDEGKVTAVGEGEAVVTISCGTQSVSCTFTCNFDADATDATDETEEATTEPEETLKDVTLTIIRWTDLTFDGPNQAFTFVLDGLSNTEVTWTSEDESIVTVDENGYVLSIGSGKTTIICEYGDQRIEIPVNCNW